MNDDAHRFSREVLDKAIRKLHAQNAGAQPPGLAIGMLGVIGWSVVVPTLLGALIGAWHDKHHPGPHSWTLALLAAGLTLGCANAWHWIAAQLATLRKENSG